MVTHFYLIALFISWMLALDVASGLAWKNLETISENNQPTAISSTEKVVPVKEVQKSTNNTEILCLAKNIWFEARGEGTAGMIAVAHVTVNRSKDPRYPRSICGVVYQKTSLNDKSICQFSWVCTHSGVNPRGSSWKKSLQVAKQVYGNHIEDPTDGATHFHNSTVNPVWSRKLEKTYEVGDHHFYRYRQL